MPYDVSHFAISQALVYIKARFKVIESPPGRVCVLDMQSGQQGEGDLRTGYARRK